MIIGVPKEIKNNENRVGMTPSGVAEVVKQGHRVFIQHTAGINSGFPDEAYQAVGAHILPTIEDIYATAEMIVKVKEPIITEYNLIRKGQLLFTYFHFASDRELTLAMLSNKSICLAYETVEEADHSLPLLIPMSEVAGRMSIQEGARFLEKPQGGKGILLGGVPGVKPAKVLILGGGVVGSNGCWNGGRCHYYRYKSGTSALFERDTAEECKDIVRIRTKNQKRIAGCRFSCRLCTDSR